MSRRAVVLAATVAAALIVVLGVIALLTSEPGWFLWGIVPLLAISGFFVSAARGETLGRAKLDRDERLAERRSAERKAKVAARTAAR